MSTICRVECDATGRGCEPGPNANTPTKARALARKFGWHVGKYQWCPYHRALRGLPVMATTGGAR